MLFLKYLWNSLHLSHCWCSSQMSTCFLSRESLSIPLLFIYPSFWFLIKSAVILEESVGHVKFSLPWVHASLPNFTVTRVCVKASQGTYFLLFSHGCLWCLLGSEQPLGLLHYYFTSIPFLVSQPRPQALLAALCPFSSSAIQVPGSSSTFCKSFFHLSCTSSFSDLLSHIISLSLSLF